MSLTPVRRLCAFDVKMLHDKVVIFVKLLNVSVIALKTLTYVYLVFGKSTHVDDLTHGFGVLVCFLGVLTKYKTEITWCCTL